MPLNTARALLSWGNIRPAVSDALVVTGGSSGMLTAKRGNLDQRATP